MLTVFSIYIYQNANQRLQKICMRIAYIIAYDYVYCDLQFACKLMQSRPHSSPILGICTNDSHIPIVQFPDVACCSLPFLVYLCN